MKTKKRVGLDGFTSCSLAESVRFSNERWVVLLKKERRKRGTKSDSNVECLSLSFLRLDYVLT